jgi:hypothetical protein
MKEELVVLLENCLKDVPRTDQRLDKFCKQVRSSSMSPNRQTVQKTLHAKNAKSDTLITFVPDQISSDEEVDILGCDEIEPCTQTLNLTPQMLDLPIPNMMDSKKVENNSMISDDSLLCWEKIAKPPEPTLQTSENSTAEDLDLTPPSSVASKRSIFELDTSCENTSLLDFDMPSGETAKLDVGRISGNNSICNELSVELAHLEPTLRQLQVLHRRNETSGLATNNGRKHSLRPPNSLKQYVPFMFQQAEYMRKQKKRTQSSNVLHSTPKPHNTDRSKTNSAKVERGSINARHEKKKMALKRKKEVVRQLKLALKEKEAFEKKQLKLALNQKKEAMKYRNKFENALENINRRICNQNSFWRMLSQ